MNYHESLLNLVINYYFVISVMYSQRNFLFFKKYLWSHLAENFGTLHILQNSWEEAKYYYVG
jgi:hypothetical protein